jgi:enterochelin esterase-like enzyme
VARTNAAGSPAVDDSGVTFGLVDPAGRLAGVRLVEELGLDGPSALSFVDGEWLLRIPRPLGVDRMEYLLEVVDHHGHRATITDPANPRWVPGAFGDKSVALLPGYEEPPWLAWPGVDEVEVPFDVDAPSLGTVLTGSVWSPTALAIGDPAPLLIVHDGPEYALLGGMTRYLGACIGAGLLPPLRAALLAPGARNAWYSANPAYAQALAEAVIPALDAMVPSTLRVGVGVSLGGLAMLHAHRSYPTLLDALMLQSSSFFTPQLDPEERTFSDFRAVTAFVLKMHNLATDAHPIDVVVTCGLREANLANNRRMAATLRRLGYRTQWVECRDAHNYTAWRDALHPHLTSLVSSLVAARAA